MKTKTEFGQYHKFPENEENTFSMTIALRLRLCYNGAKGKGAEDMHWCKEDQDSLEQLLRTHGQHYPVMEPTDAVKLIYQNEFGGGHLIRDEEACRAYLRREYASVEKDPQMPLYEDIGNGIVRVNLAAVQEEELEALSDAFIRSAAQQSGDLQRFLEKLELLRRLTAEGCFGFDSKALQGYLTDYEQAGFPAVSHSPAYRQAYHPAYRIVCRKRE